MGENGYDFRIQHPKNSQNRPEHQIFYFTPPPNKTCIKIIGLQIYQQNFVKQMRFLLFSPLLKAKE